VKPTGGDAVVGQQLDGLVNDAPRRAPTNQRDLSIGRSFERRRRKLAEDSVELAHPLFLGLAPDGWAGKDVAYQDALLVVIVGSSHVDTALGARQHPGRYTGRRERISLELAGSLRNFMDDLAAIDRHVASQSGGLDGLRML